MIQGHEIRLGNYFLDRHNKVLRADFIEYVQKGYVTKFGQHVLINEIEVHSITEYSDYAKPIKLTPKWLIQFGFEKTDDYGNHIYYEPKDRSAKYYYVCFNNNTISFGLSVFGICTSIIIDDKNLQYVHQFQNLYYALTGVDLTVREE